MTRHCLRWESPIGSSSLSFEQRLIDDLDFCRACFDYLLSEEDIPYTRRLAMIEV